MEADERDFRDLIRQSKECKEMNILRMSIVLGIWCILCSQQLYEVSHFKNDESETHQGHFSKYLGQVKILIWMYLTTKPCPLYYTMLLSYRIYNYLKCFRKINLTALRT